MKIHLMLPAICLVFAASCSNQAKQDTDKITHRRQTAYRSAIALIKEGKPEQAFQDLSDSLLTISSLIELDSAYYLHADLAEIIPRDALLGHAALVQESSSWPLVKDGSYKPAYLRLDITCDLARQRLLSVKSEVPKFLIERKREEKQRAKNQAVADAAEREKVIAEGVDKRAAMEETLRNNFLENNLDIKVKVSGRRKTEITLSYPLMNDVWSYKMNKAGNVSQLLDMGFKKVILTDGYDYRTVWTRKD